MVGCIDEPEDLVGSEDGRNDGGNEPSLGNIDRVEDGETLS